LFTEAPWLYEINTDDKGIGVKSKIDLFPCNVITRYEGTRLTDPNEIDRLYAREGHRYAFDLNESTTIDGLTGGIAKRFNHSCDPNCTAKIWLKRTRKPDLRSNSNTILKEEHIFYHAKKIIAADVEELTLDYMMKTQGKENGHECYCGSKTCKKTF
jgi:histone-lysine N-methyltransferase SETD1